MDLPKKEKYALPAAFILAILIIGALSFFLYNSLSKPQDNFPSISNGTINHQSQLQTYTNTAYGFEFQYPRSWEVTESPYGSPSGKVRIDVRPSGVEYPTFIAVYIVTPDYDHNSLFSRAIKSTATVGGIEGVEYDNKFADIPAVTIFLPYEDDHLVLSADKKYETILDQVVTTFEFFPRKDAPKPPSEPKVYRNQEFGFEFQYPSDWKIRENVFGSPASKFNLNVVPAVGGYLPDPVLINIVTQEFASVVSKNLSNEVPLTVTVAGFPGTKYEYKSGALDQITIIVPLKQYTMILGAKEQFKDVFSQVLNTFKFLNQ